MAYLVEKYDQQPLKPFISDGRHYLLKKKIEASRKVCKEIRRLSRSVSKSPNNKYEALSYKYSEEDEEYSANKENRCH